MILSDLSVKQPVFATMMMVALVVLGNFFLQRTFHRPVPER